MMSGDVSTRGDGRRRSRVWATLHTKSLMDNYNCARPFLALGAAGTLEREDEIQVVVSLRIAIVKAGEARLGRAALRAMISISNYALILGASRRRGQHGRSPVCAYGLHANLRVCHSELPCCQATVVRQVDGADGLAGGPEFPNSLFLLAFTAQDHAGRDPTNLVCCKIGGKGQKDWPASQRAYIVDRECAMGTRT